MVAKHHSPDFAVLLSGVVGPVEDGFDAEAVLTAQEAEELHDFEVGEIDDRRRSKEKKSRSL